MMPSGSIEFIDNPRMPAMTAEQAAQYNNYQQALMSNPNIGMQQKPVQSTITQTIAAPTRNLFTSAESAAAHGNNVSVENSKIIEKTADRVKHRRKKPETVEANTIVNVDENTSVEETSTINSYMQTTAELGVTLNQIDQVASELKHEFDNVRMAKNLKGKYNYLVGLSNSLSQLINTKANVLREINNSITKSNELDYKKAKDRRDAEAGAHDDKYIMDMYQSFIMNPQDQVDKLNQLGPSLSMVTGGGGGNINMTPIVNAENSSIASAMDRSGYLNYVNAPSEDQNIMYYSSDPNTQTVITYDAATGEKHFRLMNSITGQMIEGVKPMDDRFLEDVTLDLNKRIGKNSNLRQVYPLVIYNDKISNNY